MVRYIYIHIYIHMNISIQLSGCIYRQINKMYTHLSAAVDC